MRIRVGLEKESLLKELEKLKKQDDRLCYQLSCPTVACLRLRTVSDIKLLGHIRMMIPPGAGTKPTSTAIPVTATWGYEPPKPQRVQPIMSLDNLRPLDASDIFKYQMLKTEDCSYSNSSHAPTDIMTALNL